MRLNELTREGNRKKSSNPILDTAAWQGSLQEAGRYVVTAQNLET